MQRRELLAGMLGATLLSGCATATRSTPFVSQRISVERRGSGPDVVLIPGLAASRSVWESTIAALPGYRYHLVEVSGFNGTDARGNRETGPLVRPLAEEVARYMIEQGLLRPALVGHSLGGLMALMIMARHPDLIGKAMVVDMVPFNGMYFGGATATVEKLRSMAPVARDRYFGPDQASTRAATERLYAGFVRNDAMRPAILRQALSSDREVSGRIFEESFSLDLRGEIGTIKAPLTVVYTRAPNEPAERDNSDEIYRAGYRSVPHAELKRIDDSGHFIMLDQPERFQAELSAFLRG